MNQAAPSLHMSEPRPRSPEPDLLAALEERLTVLVERHREALKTIEELKEQLDERDSRIGQLSRFLEQRDVLRAQVRDRLDGLIDRVAQVETALSALPGGGGSDRG